MAGTATFKQFNMCLFDITMVQIFQIHEVPLEKNVLAVLNNSAGKDQKKKVELSSQRFAIGVFCPASGRV